KTFSDGLYGLGLAFHYNTITERYDVSAPTGAQSTMQTGDGLSADLGALWHPFSWFNAGAAYHMGYRIRFDTSVNNSLLPPDPSIRTRAYRDVTVPHRVVTGIGFLPYGEKIRVLLQGDFMPKSGDSVLVGSGLFSGQGGSVAEGRYNAFGFHWGLESIPVHYSDLCVKFWAGGYWEDTRIQGGYSRYHNTA